MRGFVLVLAACLSSLPTALGSMRVVELRIESPSVVNMFPGVHGTPTFRVYDLLSIMGSLALPPSAVTSGQGAPAATMQAYQVKMDDRGFFYLAAREPTPAAAAPVEAVGPEGRNNILGRSAVLDGNTALPVSPKVPAGEERRTRNKLGANAVLGMTRIGGKEDDLPPETAEEEATRLGGPLHQKLFALQRQTDEIRALAEKADWSPGALEGALHLGHILYYGASREQDPRTGALGPDPKAPPDYRDGGRLSDRDSLEPFTRALVRYGMNSAKVAALVARYAQWQEGDLPEAFHNRLLGIRAANLMAQYLAGNEPHREVRHDGGSYSEVFHEEYTTTDLRHKLALILAALLHRTAPARRDGAPTAKDALGFVEGDPNLAALLDAVSPENPSMHEYVKVLLQATDYDERPSWSENPRRRLEDLFSRGQPGLPRDQSRYAWRLGSILQFVTRAAMFVDSPELAEQAVLARARELRRRTGHREPTDQEAILAAAAELEDLIRGWMPAGEREVNVSLPDGPVRNNLIRNYHYFKAEAARLINEGAVTVAWGN